MICYIEKIFFIFQIEKISFIKEDAAKINPQLSIETKILLLLKGGEGIPNVYYYYESDRNNYMVMDLLGLSIEDLFHKSNRIFCLKTVLMIGMQMVYIVLIHLK